MLKKPRSEWTMQEVWDSAPKYKRKELLRAKGLHHSFSEVSKFEDLPKRSGGHVKRDLEELHREWRRRSKL